MPPKNLGLPPEIRAYAAGKIGPAAGFSRLCRQKTPVCRRKFGVMPPENPSLPPDFRGYAARKPEPATGFTGLSVPKA